MGRSRSLRRSTPKVGKSSAEPLLAIPARSSWLFWSRSLLAKPQQRKFISSPIISRLIVPLRSGNSWSAIVMFASITHQLIPPGSTKLRSGFPKSSEMSSLAASSSRLKISIGNSSATSVATTKRPNPLSGLTPKLIGAFAPPRNQCNATLVKYHLGWKLALNLDLTFKGIHHTTLSYFRDRLLAHGQSDLAMRMIGEGLGAAGFIKKCEKQRLDSSHVVAAVARLSSLECVRETLALALEELQQKLALEQRPEFWEAVWERYVENKLDYKSSEETLQAKRRQAGADCWRLLQWVEPLEIEIRQSKQVALLREVFAQQYTV